MKIELKFYNNKPDITQKVQEVYYEREEDIAPRFSLIDMEGSISIHRIRNLKSARINMTEPDPAAEKKEETILNFCNDLIAFLTHDRQGLLATHRFMQTHPTTWKAIKQYTKKVKNND